MGQKVAFKSSVNLLKSVIVKQAGDFRKGLKELVQNSVDACVMAGVEPNIVINVDEMDDGSSVLVYRDNGCGFGDSKKAVTENFAVFGDSEKEGDDRFLGRFGMGRGQSISMIFDPEKDCLAGSIEILTTTKGRTYRMSNLRVDKKLEFELEDLGKTGLPSGTEWKIVSSDGRFLVKDVRKYVEHEFVLAFPIMVNGEKVQRRPEGRRSETDDAVFYVVDSSESFDVFDRGLRVRSAYLFNGFSGSIVTKKPLTLNFARNDMMDDERWTRVQAHVKELCLRWFETKTDKTPVTEMKQSGLLEQMSSDPQIADRFKHVPVISLANGDKASLAQLAESTVIHAQKGDRYADDLIQRGIRVLNREAEGFSAVSALLGGLGKEIVDIKAAPEAREFRSATIVPNPTDDEKAMVAWLTAVCNRMGYRRDFAVGHSPMGTLEGWTDGKTYVAIERRVLARNVEMFMCGRRLNMLLAMAPLLAHEFAHDDADDETDVHGPAFTENNLKELETMIRRIALESGVENEAKGV